MKLIIDTSSWIALVRYYLPFDNEKIIYNFFKKKIENKEFILLDEVVSECSYVAQKIVVNNLDFLRKKSNIVRTNNLLPNKRFYNLLENQFCNQFLKRRLNDAEFENSIDAFIKSADAKIILQALEFKKDVIFNDVIIVSEETESGNDNKLFKKIPAICKVIDIDCITLPQLIDRYKGEIEINLAKCKG